MQIYTIKQKMKKFCGNIYQDRTERIFVLEGSVDTQKSLLKFIKKMKLIIFKFKII